MQIYQDICKNLISRLGNWENSDDNGKVYAVTAKKSSLDSKMKRVKWPAKGVRDDVHVKSCLESKSDKGGCGHCSIKSHSTDKFFYLRPDLRPTAWVPRKRIWCFRKHLNKDSNGSKDSAKSKADTVAAATIPYDTDDAYLWTRFWGQYSLWIRPGYQYS